MFIDWSIRLTLDRYIKILKVNSRDYELEKHLNSKLHKKCLLFDQKLNDKIIKIIKPKILIWKYVKGIKINLNYPVVR